MKFKMEQIFKNCLSLSTFLTSIQLSIVLYCSELRPALRSLAGFKRSADPGLPDGLDLSVSLPFDMLRRRYAQSLGGQKSNQVSQF